MPDLSKTVELCSLWQGTLAPKEQETNQAERERLRASFLNFRQKANLLALEIAKDLPDLTVHDLSHLDALWEVASQIVGPDYRLTPAEAYVLGGSFLLHDLAMSIAATPGGLSSLTQDPRWADSIYSFYETHCGRAPSKEEFQSPNAEARQFALFSILRLTHAENAEQLAFMQFGHGAETQFLIEDNEIRQTFGRVIGQIAHSHWWSLTEVENKLDRRIGAPHWAPSDWTIDPMKLACILRAADAAHVDARRAPSFQKTFSNIQPASRIHWTFQEKLNKAYVKNDGLVFTSGQAFSLQESSAWWLCLETLQMVDAELRSIDSLLAEHSMPRFLARRVAGVDRPERLAHYIQTIDWHPIHAAVHISDLPSMIRSLGGEELYGRNPAVPLRELIQNASDAVRARRFFEERPADFGTISVELIEDSGAYKLKVTDDGVGMSSRVLTQYLLDFGSSFWHKSQAQEEFPGLLSTGFRSTGQYGIGFFSVFMAADHVKVVSRRPDAAANDTMVLEFGSGLNDHPILRPGGSDERLRDGGTVVELLLRTPPDAPNGILAGVDGKSIGLSTLCQRIAPTLEVKLVVSESGSTTTVISPRDWLSIDGQELLLERCPTLTDEKFSTDVLSSYASKASANLQTLTNDTGEPIARICITAADISSALSEPTFNGAITVGGFRASFLQGIAGFIVGTSLRAARDYADPIISNEKLAQWASEQATLIPNLYQDPESQMSAAQTIRVCGGRTGILPIARHLDNWVTVDNIESLNLPDEIIILDQFSHDYELKYIKDLKFKPNVFITNSSGLPAVFQKDNGNAVYGSSWNNEDGIPYTLAGAVIEAIARAWGVPVGTLSSSNNFEREKDVLIGVSGSTGDIRIKAMIICRPIA